MIHTQCKCKRCSPPMSRIVHLSTTSFLAILGCCHKSSLSTNSGFVSLIDIGGIPSQARGKWSEALQSKTDFFFLASLALEDKICGKIPATDKKSFQEQLVWAFPAWPWQWQRLKRGLWAGERKISTSWLSISCSPTTCHRPRGFCLEGFWQFGHTGKQVGGDNFDFDET